MSYKNDVRIDSYIETLPLWQQTICQTVRTLIHQADPEVEETIKRTTQPYFTLKGNICALLAAKDHVNIFIYDPLVPDPEHLINQGHENKTAKAIQLYKNDTLNERAFIHLIQAVIAHNRADGWRKIQS